MQAFSRSFRLTLLTLILAFTVSHCTRAKSNGEARPGSTGSETLPGYLRDRQPITVAAGGVLTVKGATARFDAGSFGADKVGDLRVLSQPSISLEQAYVVGSPLRLQVENADGGLAPAAELQRPWQLTMTASGITNREKLFILVIENPGATDESISLVRNTSFSVTGAGGEITIAWQTRRINVDIILFEGEPPANVTEGVSITLISPARGSSAGGTELTIQGTALTAELSITIDGAACIGAVVHTSSRMTCTTPAHAPGPVIIVISQVGAILASSNYSYVASGSSFLLNSTGAPQGRYYHRAVWTGSKMIVHGGSCSADEVCTSMGIYDPAMDTWQEGVAATPASIGARDHAAVWTGSQLLVWGGATVENEWTNAGALYDPATNSWTTISNVDAPVWRQGYTSVWTGTHLVIWGGRDAFTSPTSYNTGAMYSPATDTWTAMTLNGAPGGVYGPVAAWTGDRVLIGGGLGGGNAGQTTVKFFDPTTNSWTPGANFPSPISQAPAGMIDGKIWVWSRGGTGDNDSIVTWNPVSPASWSTFEAPGQRNAFAHAVVGNKLFVAGGINSSHNEAYGTLLQFNSIGGGWSNLGTPQASLDPLTSAAAISTGGEFIVWGGTEDIYDSDAGIIQSGYIYIP